MDDNNATIAETMDPGAVQIDAGASINSLVLFKFVTQLQNTPRISAGSRQIFEDFEISSVVEVIQDGRSRSTAEKWVSDQIYKVEKFLMFARKYVMKNDMKMVESIAIRKRGPGNLINCLLPMSGKDILDRLISAMVDGSAVLDKDYSKPFKYWASKMTEADFSRIAEWIVVRNPARLIPVSMHKFLSGSLTHLIYRCVLGRCTAIATASWRLTNTTSATDTTLSLNY
jgi:hypothetical protein